jgi:hypothetical protein
VAAGDRFRVLLRARRQARKQQQEDDPGLHDLFDAGAVLSPLAMRDGQQTGTQQQQ